MSGDYYKHDTHLIIALNPKLQITQVKGNPAQSLDARGFVRLSADGLSAFYDWLRDRHGAVIGLRYIPIFPDDAWIREIPVAPSVERTPTELRVYFTDDKGFVEAKSSDQDFGACHFYRSRDGGWLIVVHAAALSEEELANGFK